jgi:uncharacterized membrane protein (DUF485 family)
MRSILVLFVLISISYQPLVADEPIETINQSKLSINYADESNAIKYIHNRIIKLKSQSDCNCLSNGNERLCAILTIIILLLYFPIILIIDLLPEALGQLLFFITYPIRLITLKIADLYVYYECGEYIEP